MRSTRIRIVTALAGVAAAVSMSSPAAADSACSGKFTETCQQIQNWICWTFEKCL